MKVLNWVTRRFLNIPSCIAVLPDEVEENDNVNSKYDVEETQALLEHGTHFLMDIDVLEDWKDGILSIGTLAISPLEAIDSELNGEVENTNDLNYNNVDENLEENPLMNVKLFSHELETEIGSNKEIIEDQATKEVIEIIELEEDNEDLAKGEWQTIKKRVTLADLLLEDSDHKLVKQFGDNKLHNQADIRKDMVVTASKPCVKMIKPNSRTKQGLSKAKKALKDDLYLIKKLNQLMKRMMKKKIHPDLEGKMQADMGMQPRDDIVGNPTNDSASQLLIQGTDAVV